MAKARQPGGAPFVLLTLTSQDVRPDDEMRAALARFQSWGRKYLRGMLEWYVAVAEDQARGVLHFHLLLARRIPKRLFLRMRALWADTYGMGPGSVDIKPMRSAKGAAKYLAKYVVKTPRDHLVRLDGEGRLQFSPWRVSRHTGRPFARDRFHGNPYRLSAAARYGTRPLTEFAAPAGTIRGLDRSHGRSWFLDSPEEAHELLAALVSDPSP